jgi:hypothetical protein
LKYDMKSIVAAIKVYLFGLAAQHPPNGGEHIIEAGLLREWALCGRLIASLDVTQSDEYGALVDMRRMMDWRGWTSLDMQMLRDVNPRFEWAVCKAGTKHAGANKSERISYEPMGEDVAKLWICEFDQSYAGIPAYTARSAKEAEEEAESWLSGKAS